MSSFLLCRHIGAKLRRKWIFPAGIVNMYSWVWKWKPARLNIRYYPSVPSSRFPDQQPDLAPIPLHAFPGHPAGLRRPIPSAWNVNFARHENKVANRKVHNISPFTATIKSTPPRLGPESWRLGVIDTLICWNGDQNGQRDDWWFVFLKIPGSWDGVFFQWDRSWYGCDNVLVFSPCAGLCNKGYDWYVLLWLYGIIICLC